VGRVVISINHLASLFFLPPAGSHMPRPSRGARPGHRRQGSDARGLAWTHGPACCCP
jgi:hypothetical protein